MVYDDCEYFVIALHSMPREKGQTMPMVQDRTEIEPARTEQPPERGLTPQDRALLTPEVVERWTRNLGPDDEVEPAEIVRLERGRQRALQTIRQGPELTDLEFKLVRFLQRAAGRTRSYVQIANHLWGSTGRPITGAMLRYQDGYASPYIRHIWTLISAIRQKLEIDPLRPQHVATLRGVGYSWYDAPPALDDGVDYAARARSTERDRLRLRADFGLQIAEPDEPRDPGRPMLGPEHPSYEPIEGEVRRASSKRALDEA
jgi:hypothetical protein